MKPPIDVSEHAAVAERWRAVPGYEGSYEVSDLGRVRSLDREVQCSGPVKGAYTSKKRGRVLQPGPMPGGHLSVSLGRSGSRCVHELVLLAFVGERPPRMEARHLNGAENDNRLDNLVWDTRGNNNRDKKWHKGCSRYKLSPEQVKAIKSKRSQRVTDVAEEFNVCSSTIYLIRQGKIHVDV